MAYVLSSIVVFIISAMEAIGTNFGIQSLLDLTQSIPLAEYGFSWLLPAAVFFVIGALIPCKSKVTPPGI